MAEGRTGVAGATCSLCERQLQLLETKLQQKCKNTTEELDVVFEWESSVINNELCKVCERDQLNNLFQRVERIGISIDEEHKGVRSEIHEGFEKIEQFAKNRKGELLKKLEFIVQEYLVAIGEVQKILEEKISALDSATQNEAENKYEFLSAYCNKQQGSENLKSLDEAKHMVEMLESRIGLRFQFQPAPLITSLENLGEVETGTEKSLASQTENGVIEKIVKQHCQLEEGQNLASYKSEASEIKMDSVMGSNVNERAIVVSQLVNGDSVIGCNVNELGMVASQLGNGSIFEEKSLLHNQSKLDLTRGTDVDGKFEDYTLGFQGLVSVIHVVNPCHFYVQKSSEKKMAALLAAEADSLYGSMDMKICPTAVLELGERIVVKSNIFHAWRRGTITKLVSSGEKKIFDISTNYKITDLVMIQVFLLDFGHTEILLLLGADCPVKKLDDGEHVCIYVSDFSLHVQKLNPQLKGPLNDMPPLAIKCSLKDIVPANLSNIWNVEVKNQFTRIVYNKTIQMIVLGEDGDRLLVDLKKPPLDKMENDFPVSLRDALVFLKLAWFVGECSVTSALETNQLSMQYYPPVIPPFLKEIPIMVTHINSPLDFYIHLVDNEDLLTLTKNMVELYERKDVNLEILCPVVGQACAALFDDGGWYRCQINGLPGPREVDVIYVDYGNTERIPVTKIRKLKQDFLTLPIQALHCRLSNVEPVHTTEGWNDSAKERFEHLTLNKCMWCITYESVENTLSVHLFDSTMQANGIKRSINGILVEENLASFVKNCSTDIVEVHNNSNLNFKQVHEHEELDICQDDTKSQQFEGTGLLVKRPSNSIPDLGQHIDAKVTFVASPNSIFVQTVQSQHLLKDLQKEMKEVYSSSEPNTVEWEENRDYVLLSSETKEWRRAKVTKVISDKMVEVFCYDFGNKEMVNKCELKQLKEEFQFEPLALECCLSSIRPAGGSLKWAATSCDFLEGTLIGSSVLIKIEESSSKSPLPVKLYRKDEIGQFINVAQYLIKKGLALPQKIDKQNGLKQNDSHESMGPAPEYLAHNREFCESKKVYKSPIIPNMNVFNVEVTGVGDDGTIYGMPISLKDEFTMLTSAMQTSFKALPYLKPYCYSKGEGCVVKGSDTLWYRGRIMKVLGGSVKVHYVDRGYSETIPQCHVYPMLMYPDIPELCLPFQLYGVTPVGNNWQDDAVDTLTELLVQRILEVEIMECSENSTPVLSVDLHLDGISVSSFMIHHNHAVLTKKAALTLKKDLSGLNNENASEENWDLTFKGLLSSQFETNILPEYDYPQLPLPGQIFPVTVKHIETPIQVYISLDARTDVGSDSDTDDNGINSESTDDLVQSLRELNPNAEALPLLTDFRSEMPCLAEYSDGRWYRAKVLSIDKLQPLMILVQHVDFGSTALLPHNRLRQIPADLVKHPAQAIKVKLAGFKPPGIINDEDRLPYSPEWSMQAVWRMVDMVKRSQLTAFLVSLHPEVSVFLYEEGSLIHLPLVENGLADLDINSRIADLLSSLLASASSLP